MSRINQTLDRSFLILAIASLALFVSGCLLSSGPTVEMGIRDEGTWWVSEQPLVAEGDSFKLSIENRSNQIQEYVVVALFDGRPDALPVRNGVLDVSLSGVVFDVETPDVAKFGVVHSKVGIEGEGGAGFEPAVIGPGDSQTVTIGDRLKGGGGPGEYVVLSHQTGRYEAGDYVHFTLTDSSGEVPTAIRPSPMGNSTLAVGDLLPSWSGPELNGGTFHSSELAGSDSLILILTDNHDLADLALGTFMALVEDFGDEVAFVVVDTFEGVDRSRMVELTNSAGITSPVVLDENGDLESLAKPDGPGIFWIFTDESGAVTGVETGTPHKQELTIFWGR